MVFVSCVIFFLGGLTRCSSLALVCSVTFSLADTIYTLGVETNSVDSLVVEGNSVATAPGSSGSVVLWAEKSTSSLFSLVLGADS